MTSELNSIQDFQELLTERERESILLRHAMWTFLNGEHTSKETKACQIQVRDADKALGEIFYSLLDKNKPEEFKLAAVELCDRYRALGTYIQHIADALDRDYATRHAAEDRAKIDVVKNASFLLAATGGFIAAAKAGVGNGVVSVTQAAAIGMGASGGVLARKKIAKGFVTVGKYICRRINTDPTLIYLEHTARKKIRIVSKAVRLLGPNI
jgi:hypothetical protein